MINTADWHFIVTRYQGRFLIEWRYPGERKNLAHFLYLAKEWGCTYEVFTPGAVRTRGKESLELRPLEGASGGYRHGLLFDLAGNVPYRLIGGTHYLTQHGLDGIPVKITEALRHPDVSNMPRFRVEAKNGLFVMTPSDWWSYFASGRNSDKLTDLALRLPKKQKFQQGNLL